MEHALTLTDPKLIIADASRAKRIEARCRGRQIVTVPVEQPVETALADLLHDRDENSVLPEMAAGRRCDHPVHLRLDRRG